MANVFGDPVPDDIVSLIYPTQKITPELRAKVAMQYMNAGGRDVNCQNYVHNLKSEYGNEISALCMIFNATGSTLTYKGYHDWHANCQTPPCNHSKWPVGWEHTHPTRLSGSESAVIYRGKNAWGDYCDWMLAWWIPYIGDNHVSVPLSLLDY